MGLRISSMSSEEKWWGHQYEAEDLEACCPDCSWGCPRKGVNPQILRKTDRKGSWTCRDMGQWWGSWRTILGCTCLCICLCVARGDQETLITVTGQAEHFILATGGIHFVLISVHGYILSSKGLSSKPARGEQDVLPQGTCTQHLPVGPMDLELQQHCLCWGNGFGSLCCWKQREAFTDMW